MVTKAINSNSFSDCVHLRGFRQKFFSLLSMFFISTNQRRTNKHETKMNKRSDNVRESNDDNVQGRPMKAKV